MNCYSCAKKGKNQLQDIETGRVYCQQCYKAGLMLQNYRLVELDKGDFKFALFRKKQKLAEFVSRRIAEEVFYGIYCGKQKEVKCFQKNLWMK